MMLGLPFDTRGLLAAGVTDMHAGLGSPAAKVQPVLECDPFSGHVFMSQASSAFELAPVNAFKKDRELRLTMQHCFARGLRPDEPSPTHESLSRL
jgi:transposase